MTIRVVADTHAVLWYLYNDSRLSGPAGAVMDATDAAGEQIAMSSIVLTEMVYLIEKGRIDAAAFERVLMALPAQKVRKSRKTLPRFLLS